MKNYARYAIGVVSLLIVVILIVIGFRAIRNAFSSGDEPRQQSSTQRAPRVADAARENKPVQFTIHGSVVGNEEFRSVRITVDRTTRTIDVLQGYNESPIKSQTLPNTQEAYQAFVDALQGAGFSNNANRENPGIESEVCPLGRKYSYVIDPTSTSKHYLWSVSCTNTQGTFGGNRGTVQRLFQDQIPDYGKFVTGVDL